MQKQRSPASRIAAYAARSQFFWIVVGLFVLETVWISLSGRYPMAFDEDFHLGIIRLYAHHLSPFWEGQPDGANAFGAMARDPSYLFHYLLSFPYRLVSVFTQNQTAHVIVLRVLNVALITASLPLYRRLLLRTGASKALVHMCFAVFVLIPIVPLLAAQINYDNLLLPLTALTLLAALAFTDRLRRQKRLDLRLLACVAGLCLFGGLVKYAYLPIAAVVVGYVLLATVTHYRWSLKQLGGDLRQAVKNLPVKTAALLAVGLLVLSGLFLERYGVNMVRYHTPVPDCGQVLDVEACSEYGPWGRDYQYSLTKNAQDSPPGLAQPFVYTADWFYGMWLRTFFAVAGPDLHFQTRGPFVVPAISAIGFVSAAAVLFAVSLKRIRRHYNMDAVGLFLAVSAFYTAVLWLDQFQRYLQTGRPVAVNGRYLLPVTLLILILGAIGLNEALRGYLKLKVVTAAIVVGCLLCGGGALTYILRSNDAWYWPVQPVHDVNYTVKKTLGPLVPGYTRPTQFLR